MRYSTPNAAASPLLPATLRANPVIFPPADVVARTERLEDVGEAVVVLLLLLLAACDGPTSPNNDWLEVKEQTSCEALVPAFCMGTYGLTVHNDGRYIVGPAPNGARLTGALSASEWMQISADVAAVAANLPGNPACDESPRFPPGSSDRIDLLLAGHGLFTVFRISAGGTCYIGGRESAIRLDSDLRALTLKYYPIPFPQ